MESMSLHGWFADQSKIPTDWSVTGQSGPDQSPLYLFAFTMRLCVWHVQLSFLSSTTASETFDIERQKQSLKCIIQFASTGAISREQVAYLT